MDLPSAPAPKPQPRLRELHVYYLVVAFYFFAFGMQFVLFPALVAFFLDATPQGVGLAQTALSGPLFCLLLFGGLFAERVKAGPTLARLHILFAIAALWLAAAVAQHWLTYATLINYALFVGSCAAFMMPVRDAALNGVVARDAAAGLSTPLATAAAVTTAVQIGAQIAGILTARMAGADPAPFLVLQALVLLGGAGVSLMLRAPKPTGHERTLSGALRDLKEGVTYSFGNPIMAPMLISAFCIGVFGIGAMQVLFPLIVREDWGGDAHMQANRLGVLLAAFWGASFVSAALLSRARPMRRPGRAMVASHFVGAIALFTFTTKLPFWAFISIVSVWGFAAGIAISSSRSIVQGAAEPRYLGRVLSVYSMGFMGGGPIGSAIVGYAVATMGASTAAIIPAIGLGAAVIGLGLFTPLWRFEAQAQSAP